MQSRTRQFSVRIIGLIRNYSFLYPEWMWTLKYKPFAKIGTDVFIVVAPSRNIMYVADAAAICQITRRHNDFPKPTELYWPMNLFGRNVLTTEGVVWRFNRKFISPAFNNNVDKLVWTQSLYHARAMLDAWIGDSRRSSTLVTTAADTLTLSFNVICGAGFGLQLQLQRPGTAKSDHKVPYPPVIPSISTEYTMSFRDAFSTLLTNIVLVLLIPGKVLGKFENGFR